MWRRGGLTRHCPDTPSRSPPPPPPLPVYWSSLNNQEGARPAASHSRSSPSSQLITSPLRARRRDRKRRARSSPLYPFENVCVAARFLSFQICIYLENISREMYLISRLSSISVIFPNDFFSHAIYTVTGQSLSKKKLL